MAVRPVERLVSKSARRCHHRQLRSIFRRLRRHLRGHRHSFRSRCFGTQRQWGPHLARRQTDPGSLGPQERSEQLGMGYRGSALWLHNDAVLLQSRARLRRRGRQGRRGPGRKLDQPAFNAEAERRNGSRSRPEHRRRYGGQQERDRGLRDRLRRVRGGQRRLQPPVVPGPQGGAGVTVRRDLDAVRSLRFDSEVPVGGRLPIRLGPAPGRERRGHVDAAGQRQRDGRQREAGLVGHHRIRTQRGCGCPSHRVGDPRQRHPRCRLDGPSRRLRRHGLRPATHRNQRRRDGGRRLDLDRQRLDLRRALVQARRPHRRHAVRHAGEGGGVRRRRGLVGHRDRHARCLVFDGAGT